MIKSGLLDTMFEEIPWVLSFKSEHPASSIMLAIAISITVGQGPQITWEKCTKTELLWNFFFKC